MIRQKRKTKMIFGALLLLVGMTTACGTTKEVEVSPAEALEITTNGITASATFAELASKKGTVDLEDVIVQEVYGGYGAYQDELDAGYLAVVAENDFTPENPYIIVNPYEIAPQSALIIFETEEAVSITTSILGKTEKATITHTGSEEKTYHEIPLIGLYAGENTVELTLSSGELYTYAITTQDIPVGYMREDTMEVLASDASQLSDGLYLLKDVGRTILDVNGDVRGYFTIGTATSGCDEVTADGHIFVSVDEYTNYPVILELDYMGQVYRELYANGMNTHHDGYLIDENTFLLGTSYIDFTDNSVTYYDPAFEEIFNYAGGSIEVRSYGDMDALHLNTVANGGDGYILVSFRNQHAVAKLSYPELEVVWVLSVSDDVYMGAENKNLTPIGDDFEWFYSQHDVSLVSENGDGTVDITLFDNGVHRGLDVDGEYPAEDLYSRMVHYRVDEVNMTVEQIWDYGEELGNQYLAFVHSSTQYIPESNTYLGNFDAHDAIETGGSEVPREACYIIELTEDKEVVFEIALDEACYRTEKLHSDVLYSAWEGIGLAEKTVAFIGEDASVAAYIGAALQDEPAVFQLISLSATKEWLDIAGWVSIASAKDSVVSSRQLLMTNVETGESHAYTLSMSPWQLREAVVSDEDRESLDRTAGFCQKRMDISDLEDGDYALTLVANIDGKNYMGELEQVLRIG